MSNGLVSHLEAAAEDTTNNGDTQEEAEQETEEGEAEAEEDSEEDEDVRPLRHTLLGSFNALYRLKSSWTNHPDPWTSGELYDASEMHPLIPHQAK